jgi:hypothetical protein
MLSLFRPAFAMQDDHLQTPVQDTIQMIINALDIIQEDVKANEVEEEKEMILRITSEFEETVFPNLEASKHENLALDANQAIENLETAIKKQDKQQILIQCQIAKGLFEKIQNSIQTTMN